MKSKKEKKEINKEEHVMKVLKFNIPILKKVVQTLFSLICLLKRKTDDIRA